MLNFAQTIAHAAVLLAGYAQAVRWSWQDLQHASDQGVNTAEEHLQDAATARTAAAKKLRDGQTEPDSEATTTALFQLECRSGLEFEVTMFAACAHAAADDYAEGHFGPPSQPAAYGAWLDAYHSCSSEVDAFVTPLKVGGKECAAQFTTAAVTRPDVDVRGWSEREAAARSNQKALDQTQAADALAKLQEEKDRAKKEAKETLDRRDTAEALVQKQGKEITAMTEAADALAKQETAEAIVRKQNAEAISSEHQKEIVDLRKLQEEALGKMQAAEEDLTRTHQEKLSNMKKTAEDLRNKEDALALKKNQAAAAITRKHDAAIRAIKESSKEKAAALNKNHQASISDLTEAAKAEATTKKEAAEARATKLEAELLALKDRLAVPVIKEAEEKYKEKKNCSAPFKMEYSFEAGIKKNYDDSKLHCASKGSGWGLASIINQAEMKIFADADYDHGFVGFDQKGENQYEWNDGRESQVPMKWMVDWAGTTTTFEKRDKSPGTCVYVYPKYNFFRHWTCTQTMEVACSRCVIDNNAT